MLQMYARKRKLEYRGASNGREAVAAYKTAFSAPQANDDEAGDDDEETGSAAKVYPDVVFMDINMPVLDGFDATRQIRAFERNQGLQPAVIIALSGFSSNEARGVASSCGFTSYMTKPVRHKQLDAVLNAIMDSRNKKLADALQKD